MKPYIAVMIKPTLQCERSCRHCYHLPEERGQECISLERLDKLFKLVSEEYRSAWFIWHGGDPLELPFSFYRKAFDLQNRYFGKDAQRVGNTIQTNGVNLNKRLIRFFDNNKVNVGVSYDGPYNDVLRNMTEETENAIRQMQKQNAKFTVSCTLSDETADKQVELYRHFRNLNIAPSFSPVVPKGCAAKDESLIPDPEKYIKSSIEVFDEWLYDTETEVPLLPHYLYILNAIEKPAFADCAHTSCLGKWLCIYPDGNLYPCAKGCPEEYIMGNIDDIGSIGDVFVSEGFANILEGTVVRRDKCMDCEIYRYCAGGCSIDAECEVGLENIDGPSCRIYKAVFTHVKKAMDSILEDKPDMSQYNKFVKDAVLGKLINPSIMNI